MTKYTKLVRDKIPEILDAKKVPYTKRVANETEYKEALVEKLLEEVREFSQTPTEEELADVLEVVNALTKLPEYRATETARKIKHEERGGFEKRIILSGEK
ncbi:MAG: nucleoside triphosphate pyrophosphohydrolase [Candidatus Paceibacterota bacterium]